MLPDTRTLLERLIAFPTVSRSGNLALVDHVAGLFAGTPARLTRTDDGQDANLLISVGPEDQPGIMLSGHSDVVPVAGQPWTYDPFRLTEHEDRLHGRGTADMKGFVAAAIRAMLIACTRDLKTPLELAISFDEEIGCIGVRSLIGLLEKRPIKPLIVWIGEPTHLRLASGHKGKSSFLVTATGRAAHSALTPQGLNAIHLCCDLIAALRTLQDDVIARSPPDPTYDVGYTTIHVGTIHGGEALNIVPNTCQFEFEIRDTAADDVAALLARIEAEAERIVAPLRAQFLEAAFTITPTNAYPGLDTRHPQALALARTISGDNGDPVKLAFGTEGGLFSTGLGTPAIICGPGSMDQGHKPDEFVTQDQLDRCDAMLARLISQAENGIAWI